VIDTARETAPGTRTRPADEVRKTDDAAKEGAATNGTAQTKSGETRTRTQGTAKVISVSNDLISNGGRAPMVFGRRATYFDNPRLALFAPPRWPGGGGGRSARRSAKS
jgi:hypothetical protein